MSGPPMKLSQAINIAVTVLMAFYFPTRIALGLLIAPIKNRSCIELNSLYENVTSRNYFRPGKMGN